MGVEGGEVGAANRPLGLEFGTEPRLHECRFSVKARFLWREMSTCLHDI